ncbi:fungal-specific transcription factor domain-containing protein [Mycena sp. CBHHK59/15]|nr:fungal-specific transcription factor domain-containing protein [Mycena sp. CBHHK59/15]
MQLLRCHRVSGKLASIDTTDAKSYTVKKRKGYTDALEARLALAEQLLRKLSSSSKLPETLSQSPESSQWSKGSHMNAASSQSPGVELTAMSIRAMNEPGTPLHDDDLSHLDLVQDMKELSIHSHTDQFLGKSSGAALVKAAIQLKEDYTTDASSSAQFPMPWGSRRMHYWTFKPWIPKTEGARYVFPDPELLSSLVALHFEHVNVYLPLLHRPTFEKSIADGLHLKNDRFGGIVLLVCAIGSRFSDDPRVFNPEAPLTCGWQYFYQLPLTIDHLFAVPTLYDLQYYCLAIQFLEASALQAEWSFIGIGIRVAQEVGAHRRKTKGQRPTVESELWKRAFWVLVYYDRITSCGMGRPAGMQYDDFDVELPTECDDEYWEPKDPALAFKQPAGKPSRITFFSSFLRLNNILGFTHKTLYALNKTKQLLAVRDDAWEEHLVAELDSALNKWVDSIPEHLRWDPHREDPIFFRQSVALYCSYYHVQMTMHRPFIPMIRQTAPTALPSLAICTNAARSCSHVADISCQRMGRTPVLIVLPGVTTAGVILGLNVWSGKRTGLAPHMNSAINEVKKCMRVLRVCEQRWQMAGLYWDILNELASVGQVPLTQHPSPSSSESPPERPNNKRTNDAHDRRYTVETPFEQSSPWSDRQLQATFDDLFAWVGATEPQSLPMYSTDLGRLPVFMQAPTTGEPQSVPADTGWYPDQAPQAQLPMVPVSTAGTSSGGDDPFPVPHPTDVPATSLEDITSMIHNDVMAMWANAPTGLGADEWGTYFSEINQGR